MVTRSVTSSMVRLSPQSDVSRLVVRWFPDFVHLETYDRESSCLITAQMTIAQAIEVARELLAAAGVQATPHAQGYTAYMLPPATE